MTFTGRRVVLGWSGLVLSLLLAGACGDSAHTIGSTGDGGRGGTGGTTPVGGAGGGGNGGAGAGGTVGAGGAAATGGGGIGGASAGTGGAGRGGSGGGAGATAGRGGTGGAAGSGGDGGAAAGRGGTGGAAGNGNAGGAAAGTTGRGGTGGGVAGSGGTGGAANACQSVQTLDRSCTTDADCFSAVNIADCCGQKQYIGLHTTVQNIYTGLEAQCQATWPACTCPTRPTVTDDGSTIKSGMSVGVTCRQGVCTTFVPACGGPCAAGTTCFSCQIATGQYGACTTPCTDVAASSDCTIAARPRCQLGSSGNVDGTYCTAAGVMCNTRSLTDCAGLTCASNEQVVNVRNPALGMTECACVPLPSAGKCMDCTCGEPLCTPYGGHCTGYTTDKGLACTLNG